VRHASLTQILAGPLACILCVALAGGCSSTPQEPDDEEPAEQTVGKPDTDDEPAESTAEADTADQPDSAADAGPVKVEEGDDVEDEEVAIGDDFRRKLASALDSASGGDRDAAVDSLQKLVDEPGAGFLAAFNLGVLYENEGDYQNAARRYSQALQKNPDFSPALLNLARLYIRLDQPSDARKLTQRYTEARPENMDHRAIALQVELHEGKYEEVIRKAKQILRRDETNAEAMIIMAEANIQLDRTELAEAILERARKLQPERAEIYFKYSKIRSRQERIADAIALLERALKHRPDFPEAHNNLGVLLHDAGNYDDAVAQLRAALASFPDYKQAYLNLGNALKAQRKFREAEQAFKDALEIDARYADALFNLGVLYLDTELEGIDKIARLNKSIEYFESYKQAATKRLPKDNLADKYIDEARKTIEVEKQREEMMRQAQKPADDDATQDDGDSADSADGGGSNQ
jgi:tetratricopeptide (TPR) repeat protein